MVKKAESYVTCIHHSDAGHDYYYDTLPAIQCKLQLKVDFGMMDVVSEKDNNEEPTFQRMKYGKM